MVAVKKLATVEDFYRFLEDYAGFFARLAQDEQFKLEALLSNQLEDVERAVAKQQSTSMQMEQYEKKRLELQQELGFGDVTLSALQEKTPESEQQRLRQITQQIRDAVDQVRFYNNKSMELVRTNLELINGELPPSERATPQAYTPKGKQDPKQGPGSSLFHAKI